MGEEEEEEEVPFRPRRAFIRIFPVLFFGTSS
jgi:hypothetical protein